MKNPSLKNRGVLLLCHCYFLVTIFPKPHATHEIPSNPHIHHSKICAVWDGFAGSWMQKYQGNTTAYKRNSPIAGIHQPPGVLPVILSLLQRRITAAKIPPAIMHNAQIVIKISVLIFLNFFGLTFVYKYTIL